MHYIQRECISYVFPFKSGLHFLCSPIYKWNGGEQNSETISCIQKLEVELKLVVLCPKENVSHNSEGYSYKLE